MVCHGDAIKVARRTGDIGNNRLLLASKRVEQIAFANIWSADECDA
jgi:hypothetical protein